MEVLIQMIWNSWIQMTTIFSILRRKRAKNNKRKYPGKVMIEIEISIKSLFLYT